MEDTNAKTDKAIKSIERSIKNINKQVAIITEQYEDANLYITMDTVNIINGDSHEAQQGAPREDIIIATCYPSLSKCDCGDW